MSRIPTNGLFMPGFGNNNARTATYAGIEITGDIDVMARIQPESWRPTVDGTIISKYDAGSNQRSYRLILTSAGRLNIGLSLAGTVLVSASSGIVIPRASDPVLWVRFNWRASDGRVQFFTAPDSPNEPLTWTALGTDQTLAIASIYNSPQSLYTGSQTGGTSPFKGMIYRSIVKNGIAGTKVYDANFVQPAGTTSFNDSASGQSVTVFSSGAGGSAITGRALNSMRMAVRPNTSSLDFGLAGAATNTATFSSSAAMSAANLTSYSYGFWINPRTAGGGGGFGRLIDAAPFFLQTQVSGTGFVFKADVQHSVTAGSSSTGKLDFGKWYRVLVTWSDADLRPNIYVNGSLSNATGTDKSGTRTATLASINIGNRSAVDRALNGRLDEFAIWNRVLSTAEVLRDEQGATPAPSGLLLYYKMDEGSGTSLTDSSGNSITGTISGASYSTDVPFKNRSSVFGRVAP